MRQRFLVPRQRVAVRPSGPWTPSLAGTGQAPSGPKPRHSAPHAGNSLSARRFLAISSPYPHRSTSNPGWQRADLAPVVVPHLPQRGRSRSDQHGEDPDKSRVLGPMSAGDLILELTGGTFNPQDALPLAIRLDPPGQVPGACRNAWPLRAESSPCHCRQKVRKPPPACPRG